MSESVTLLPLSSNEMSTHPDGWEPERIEKREKVVRIVEYSAYPRVHRRHKRLVGFTRDESKSGMCIVAKEREKAGALLRVAVRSVDGGATREALARVVWCDGRNDGRYWVGLSLTEVLSNRRSPRLLDAMSARDAEDSAIGA